MTIHYIFYRGDIFRVDFSNLREIRSIVLEDVHLMTLTATASLSTRRKIIEYANTKRSIVYLPPVKDNIVYTVGDKSNGGISVAFQPIVTRLIADKNMGRMIVFCLFLYFI